MKSKQTLKVGQKYLVIEDCINPDKNGLIVSVARIVSFNCFYDDNGLFFDMDNDKLQLITPKKSQWKYTKSDRDSMLEWWNKFNGEERTIKLIEIYKNSLTKSTPKKKSKEIKEIEPLTLFFNENEDFYEINEMRHTDSRIDLLAEKLNQVIDTINLLIKNK